MSNNRTVTMTVTKSEERLILAVRRDSATRDYVYGLVNLSQPTVVKPRFDPKAQIKCTVDPKCKWTGKTSTRAAVHATKETLQAEGHIPVY